mgnify:CR=1 FL=1
MAKETTEPTVVDVRIPVKGAADGSGWEIAATVYAVPPGTHAAAAGDGDGDGDGDGEGAGAPWAAPVLVLLPGGGYGRRYFDLPEAGYSQAAAHARRGTVVVTLDHLGTGDSSIPPMQVTTLPVVAAANHQALTTLLDRLRGGTLAPGVLPPLQASAVVGAGQSMGGHIALGMQAHHRTFDGLALMGTSAVATTLPRRPATPAPDSDPAVPRQSRAPGAAQGSDSPGEVDWAWGWHWVEELCPLAKSDIEAGLPRRTEPRPWASLAIPGLATTLMTPGVVAAEAAAVDVPVLLAAGERDVIAAPLDEIGAYTAATDVAFFRVPRMGHMHNFAPTRGLLWTRLDAFVRQVAALRARQQLDAAPAA